MLEADVTAEVETTSRDSHQLNSYLVQGPVLVGASVALLHLICIKTLASGVIILILLVRKQIQGGEVVCPRVVQWGRVGLITAPRILLPTLFVFLPHCLS